MGSACVYMGVVEKQLLYVGENKILMWKRYIDDIFVVYDGIQNEFIKYMEEINTLYDTIK